MVDRSIVFVSHYQRLEKPGNLESRPSFWWPKAGALAMSLRVHFVKKKSGSVDLKIGYHGIKWYIMVSISQILGDFNGKLYPQMVILMGNYNHSDATQKKDMFMINIILNI